MYKYSKVVFITLFTFSAAIFPQSDVEHASSEDWSRVFDVNVRGYALVVKHVSPILKKQGSGSIVNIASIGGMVAIAPNVLYPTTKGAVISMTRNLALDLGAFNIRVNSVSPGYIDSPTLEQIANDNNISKAHFDAKVIKNTCLKRMCHASEIANMMVFLASDLCPFITGANIVVDGGYTAI